MEIGEHGIIGQSVLRLVVLVLTDELENVITLRQNMVDVFATLKLNFYMIQVIYHRINLTFHFVKCMKVCIDLASDDNVQVSIFLFVSTYLTKIVCSTIS